MQILIKFRFWIHMETHKVLTIIPLKVRLLCRNADSYKHPSLLPQDPKHIHMQCLL